ncbi:MAG: glycosyltransferase family 9 protein [Patescibacteria group bacterium]
MFKSWLKFFIKIRVVHSVRRFFLFLFSVPVNKNNWEDRFLIINLQALGDLVLFTGVLKNYKITFPNKKIYLAIKKGVGFESFLKPSFVDEIIAVDYKKFSINPIYGFSAISKLRRIGFRKVVNQDFSAAEISGKIIATSLGAEDVIGSDGLELEYKFPFDIQQEKNLKFFGRNILPLYTKIIRSKNIKSAPKENRFPSAISYYAKIFESIAPQSKDYSPTLPIPNNSTDIIRKFNLANQKYAVLNINASVAYKRWPVERFMEIARLLLNRNIAPVLIGTNKEYPSADNFVSKVTGSINLAGQTSLEELVIIIANSEVVLSNDTSTVHFAVALKKPSLCITGGGQFGIQHNYGYSDINLWVYTMTSCYVDNFRCGKRVPPGEPSPCINAVSVDIVKKKIITLLDYINNLEKEKKNCPAEPFRIVF